MRKISRQARGLLKMLEGYRSQPYKCPGGIWTIGYGHTAGVSARSAPVTRALADALLDGDLAEFEVGVEGASPGLADHEFDACVLLAFNIGLQAFRKSTLAAKLATGDRVGAVREFPRWVHAGGTLSPGLVRRREIEAAIFLG